ncbi:MAG: hypothetical protein GY769_17515 [bacterium]|nr:hypothetical protein [bacterium]
MHRLRQLAGLHRFLCNALTVLGVLAGAGAAASADVEVLYLKDVKKGQRGYGLSVFSGAEIERFEVEVLGVWENLQPKTSYVLARLEGQGLEESGVIAGMSGSPVYVDGKLLGAVSFGWPFSNEAIAGITPVQHMRTMLEEPGTPAPAVGLSDLTVGRLIRAETDEGDFREALGLLRPHRIGDAPAAIEWAAVGFGSEVRSLLSEELGQVVAAGSLAASGGQGSAGLEGGDLQPGSAVAAVLVDGDFRLAATGTVTDRVGDSILAFGHPFLGIGSLAVPMASAEVLTVVSSRLSSFKVANLGPVVGAVDFDYLTGIRGTLGRSAPVVPMVVRLGDAADPIRLSVAKIPRLTPTLAAVSVLGALNADLDTAGAQSLDLKLQFDLGDHGSVSMEQSFDGQGAPLAAAIHMFAVTGYLLQNRLAEVDLRSIEVDLTTHPEPRTLALVGAHPSRSVARPGDSLSLNVDLAAYRGGKQRHELEVSVPSNLAAGRYILLVGDGFSIDAVRLGIEQSEPRTFAQAITLLNTLHSRRELRVLGIVEGPGLSVSGEVLPDLPGSVRSLWTASGAGGSKALRMAVVEDAGALLDQPVEGLLRVDLEIKRGEPVLGNGDAGGEGGARPTPSARRKKPQQAADGGAGEDAKEDSRGEDG